jgi:hypothetical protein
MKKALSLLLTRHLCCTLMIKTLFSERENTKKNKDLIEKNHSLVAYCSDVIAMLVFLGCWVHEPI